MKSSDYIAQFLRNRGVAHVFDMAGGMISNIEDSISKIKDIECVPMHHEQAAGFAAEGYARINGKIGVALATSGPGATNLITSIGSCYYDSIPVLFITGQVNTKDIKNDQKIRQNGFQETDIVSIVEPITKHAKLVSNLESLPYELEKAIQIINDGRPGPVLLDIPFNIQNQEIDVEKIEEFNKTSNNSQSVSGDFLGIKEKLTSLLVSSKRPIIIIGNGVRLSKTENQLKSFAERNHLPVVSSLLGLDSFSSENELALGFIGIYGNRYANISLANADLIIALGTRLDLRQTGSPDKFSKQAKIIHIDIDENSSKKFTSGDIFWNIDLKIFFELTNEVFTDKKNDWLSFVCEVKSNFKQENNYELEYCDPNTFFSDFSSIAPNNSIITADVGQNQMWLAQSWQVKEGQRLLFSGGMGAMGFSLPAAIGAYLAKPSNKVFCFCGDGGFQVNIQELETIVRNKLPIKIFVLNNYSLGMVREFQDLYFDKNYQSTVIGYSCPDLKKIAKAYGLEYLVIKKLKNKTKDYNKIIKSDKPMIVELILSKDSILQPKVVYGESLENQSPYLKKEQKNLLIELKKSYLNLID